MRYRCRACGNLTRFDVVATARTSAFYHYSLAGDLSIEQVDELERHVESVTCRWCQSSSAVEEIGDEAAAAIQASEETPHR